LLNIKIINFYVLFLFSCVFSIFKILIPDSFAGDQYYYHDYIINVINGSDLDLNNFKSNVIFIISYPLFLITHNLYLVCFINFIVLVYILNRYKNNLIVLLFPSILFYSLLFLREVYLYIFIIILFNAEKKSFKYIAIIFIGLLRPDSLIIISPLILLDLFKSINIVLIFSFLLALLINLFLIDYYLESYRLIFDGFNISGLFIIDLFTYLINYLLPLSGTELAVYFSLIEFVLIIFIVIFIYYNKYYYLLITFLCSLIVGSILIGSIGDNIGFNLRLRSPMILSFLIYAIKKKYKHIY
jgi:hypothetical protein